MLFEVSKVSDRKDDFSFSVLVADDSEAKNKRRVMSTKPPQ